MDTAWLQDFLELSETRNFSRAAEIRNLSQSAFSRRIQMLEEWIGCPLVERHSRHTRLTAAGETLKPIAEEIVRQVHTARHRAIEATRAEETSLRICSTHALSIAFLPSWLRTLDETYETTQLVSLVADGLAGSLKTFGRGDAQFLVCYHHGIAPPPLSTQYHDYLTIGHDTVQPVSAASGKKPAHEIIKGATIPLLAYGSGSGIGQILSAFLAAPPFPCHFEPFFRSPVAAVLLQMAKDRKGVAWLPGSLTRPDLEQGKLVAAADPDWTVPLDIRIYRPRARQSPAAETFWARTRELAFEVSASDA
ncbi:MAG: LysR substrate-binding domain-containing protein [Hyphomonadaceae bacterium]|nr:LysR substrate-binding domain-containing protein [Hyphomonadaceae bacterium]